MSVETLLREPEAPQAPHEAASEHDLASAPAPDEPAVLHPCPTCGAALAPGQDWCLECGEASTDGLGTTPGWRTAVTVLTVTLVLAAGAVAAAYAALKADSRKAAATPAAVAALPAQPAATPTATTPPVFATPPATTPPAATPPAAPNTPKAASPATPVAAAIPATPAVAPATVKKVTKKTTSKPKKTPAKLGPPTSIALAQSAAHTYNPYAHPATDFGDPHKALDDDPSTAWTAQLPTNSSRPDVGLVVDLGSATAARRIDVVTTTPGMTIEVYGTTSSTTPVSIQDPGWTHITTQLDVAKSDHVTVGDGTKSWRKLLLWVTEGPTAGGPQVALNELKVDK